MGRCSFCYFCHKPFSNLNIALVGDFAQLPPVGDSPLYVPQSETANDVVRHGSGLYSLFKESHRLQTAHRQSGNSPEQVHWQFRDLLRHAYEGGLTQDECEY
jgi:ATP-dependent DNA helicase PIF1